MPVESLRNRLISLHNTLASMADRDPDSEVGPAALRAIDALLAEAKEQVADDPVIRETDGLFSPEAVEDGHPVLATDSRLIVGMVLNALPVEPIRTGRV